MQTNKQTNKGLLVHNWPHHRRPQGVCLVEQRVEIRQQRVTNLQNLTTHTGNLISESGRVLFLQLRWIPMRPIITNDSCNFANIRIICYEGKKNLEKEFEVEKPRKRYQDLSDDELAV